MWATARRKAPSRGGGTEGAARLLEWTERADQKAAGTLDHIGERE